MSLLFRQKFVDAAYAEGLLCLKGNQDKAGPAIEKYLSVFRKTLGSRNVKYLDPKQGYDWCCAYVYYLLKLVGYFLDITPLPHSNRTLANVRTWYDLSCYRKTF